MSEIGEEFVTTFNPKCPDDIFQKIQYALDNSSSYQQLYDRVKTHLKKFSWKGHVQKIELYS